MGGQPTVSRSNFHLDSSRAPAHPDGRRHDVPLHHRRHSRVLSPRASEAAAGMDVRIGGGPTQSSNIFARASSMSCTSLSRRSCWAGESDCSRGLTWRALGYECVQFVASEKATHVVLRRQGHNDATMIDWSSGSANSNPSWLGLSGGQTSRTTIPICIVSVKAGFCISFFRTLNRGPPPRLQRCRSFSSASSHRKSAFPVSEPVTGLRQSDRRVICQDNPHLSVHQPHALSWPPLPTIAFQ